MISEIKISYDIAGEDRTREVTEAAERIFSDVRYDVIKQLKQRLPKSVNAVVIMDGVVTHI